ncbi:MAG TPA: serine hydrolase domain-containing protein [Pyrinomonadaceae bacterium]
MGNFIKRVVKEVVNVVINIFTDAANAITGRGPALPRWEWKQETDPSVPGSNSEIDDLIKDYMKQHSVKAGQFALFVGNTLRMSSAYTWGESDYPITRTDHVMRVASCSKAFTTAAILDLLDPATAIPDPATGLPNLEFDEKVFKILFPVNPPEPRDQRVKEITVQDLLEHTGGWNYRSGPNALNDWVFHLKEIGRRQRRQTPPTKEDFAHFVLCETSLDFEPGTRPDEYFTPPDFAPKKAMDTYSNIGYVLLGMIVEKKASPFIDYLKTNILSPAPLSITDVEVGRTRQADRRANEVFYESPGSGPDATINPFHFTAAPLPYGGDGSMKELMDSGGGLIMSANSLARFITQNNVLMTRLNPNNIPALRMRQIATGVDASGVARDLTQTRYGKMPGTQAAASSFQVKGGSKLYDMAVIFNRQDISKMDWGDNSDDFDRLVRHLQEKVRENF